MYFRGVKVSIVVHFAVVVTIGMLLVGFVVLKLWQNNILDYSLSQGRLHLDLFASANAEKCLAPPAAVGDLVFYREAAFHGTTSQQHHRQIEAALLNSAKLQEEALTPLGKIWTVFGPIARDIVITRPVTDGCNTPGAVGYVIHLADLTGYIVDKLSIILVYILVNAIILVTIGFFRMTGLVIKPLEKLVHIADTFSLADRDIFTASLRKNEFGHITSTLQNMFATIEEDREKLKQTIQSLEQANSQILDNQKSLITAEKFAVVGRLSAGLAHEIGNPLGIIQGYIDLLSRDDITAEEKQEYYQRSTRELARVNTLIRQLLDISRKDSSRVYRTLVGPVIEEIVSMLRLQKTRKPVSFALSLPAVHVWVSVSEDDLHQVLLNCLLNSMDAINEAEEKEGKITISCRAVEEDDDNGLEIIIADNGCGIDEKNISAVFDPFFTTKEPGHGTGLGLAVSHAIVEKAGGTIAIASEESGNTTVTVRLPVAAESDNG